MLLSITQNFYGNKTGFVRLGHISILMITGSFCIPVKKTHTSLQKEEIILSLVQTRVVHLKNLDLQKRHLQGPTEVPRKFKHHL